MGDNFHELRLSLARRPASLFADADAIVPTREAYIREVFSRRWEFPHYGNIFHYVPHEPVAGQVALLGAIGRAFLSDENLAPEEGLEATIHKGWKASVLVVDPRPRGRAEGNDELRRSRRQAPAPPVRSGA